MATVAASTEKLAEPTAEGVQTTSAEVAQPAAAETAPEPEASSSSGDAKLSEEEEKDKALRAVRQSTPIPTSFFRL